MAGLSALSEFAGYASIACWLGAQFPQVLENIRRQSCEGLALPFLGSWFLGDLSNLIGCILTHQLPFQTYLASYFVFVDLSLLCQYIYYAPKQIPSSPPSTRVRPRATSTLSQRSIDRSAPRYRTLSAVAANVAHAAALAAQHEEHAHPRYSRRWKRDLSIDVAPEISGHRVTGSRDGLQDEVEDAANPMTLSFHSELGDPDRKRRVTWSSERRGASVGRTSMSQSTFLPNLQQASSQVHGADRGRSTQRSVDLDVGAEIETPTVGRSSRATRRGASLVFLGAWTLLGVGTLASSRRGIPPSVVSDVGRVLSVGGIRISTVGSVARDNPISIPPSPAPARTVTVSFLQDPPQALELPPPPSPPESDGHKLTSERVLGRIFAWLCTTLYLTSRLPQIWKNYVRKSVEGLSMYLFVFAFLGNCFYVLSIMTSPQVRQPPPISTAFLKESLPYLLGSAGTLMFDVTIVSQSFVYRPRLRHRSSTRHRLSEEEAGLLSADALANPPVNT